MKLTFHGTREMQSAFARELQSIGKQARREVHNIGRELAADAASLAPTDTGELAGSIHYDGSQRAVIVAADHAIHVEYGTSEMDAEEFIRPAIEAAERSMERIRVS